MEHTLQRWIKHVYFVEQESEDEEEEEEEGAVTAGEDLEAEKEDGFHWSSPARCSEASYFRHFSTLQFIAQYHRLFKQLLLDLLDTMEIILLLREKESDVFAEVFQDADATTKEARFNLIQLERQRDMFEGRRYLFRFCSETYRCSVEDLEEHRRELVKIAKDNQICPETVEEYWELKEWVRQTSLPI